MARLRRPDAGDVVTAAVGAGLVSGAHAFAHSRYGEASALGPAAVGTAGIAVSISSFLALLGAQSIMV